MGPLAQSNIHNKTHTIGSISATKANEGSNTKQNEATSPALSVNSGD